MPLIEETTQLNPSQVTQSQAEQPEYVTPSQTTQPVLRQP